MSDSFHLENRLRLLHEGIPSEPDSRSGDVPPATAAPFSATELVSSGLWPEEHLTFSVPNAVSACPFLETVSPWGYLPAPLYQCGTATSSMDVARRLIENGQLPIWGSVLAVSQSTGRGQLGRSWISPQGNVYAALRLPLLPPFNETAAAPALGGLLAEALAQLGAHTHVKWPNDLLQQDGQRWRKVGGILLEERAFPPGLQKPEAEPAYLVAGIGLNLQSHPPDNLLRTQRAAPAGCLSFDSSVFSQGHTPLALWARLVSQLFICYVEQIDGKGEHAWRTLTERRLAFTGLSVIVTDGPGDEECHRGILEGLDLSGGLRLCNGNRSTTFLSGSLQLA